MTNAEIIYSAAIENEIYTRDQATEFLEKFGTIPLHTFKRGNELGYKVKKGVNYD